MSSTFKAIHARGEHWGQAAKACLAGLEPLPPGSNVGFIYVTPAFAGALSSILTFLRETTGLHDWVGAVAAGVVANATEYHQGGALAVMVGRLPPGSFRLVNGAADPRDIARDHGDWIAAHQPLTAVVHADPRDRAVVAMLAGLTEMTDAFLVGGLTAPAEPPTLVLGTADAGGLSGMLLGSEVRLVSGLTQGCSPIGGVHTVTGTADSVLLSLDDRPALEVLKEEAGEIIARDLRRAAGYIHAALPVPGSDTGDYMVRNITGIDVARGWLAVGAQLSPGDSLMFVRRDPDTARRDMRRMLHALRERAAREGGRIAGGHYVSCVARGPHMFGRAGAEARMIREALGEFPLVGFYASGEISRDRLYAYTGVLTLFLRDEA